MSHSIEELSVSSALNNVECSSHQTLDDSTEDPIESNLCELNSNIDNANDEDSNKKIFDGTFLFSIIKESKISISDIVDQWLDGYIADIKISLLSLLQLVISSSNSQLIITKALYDNLTLTEIYKEITNNFVNDDIYPLIDSSLSSFGSTLYEFVFKLSKSVPFTFLHDDILIPEFFAFLKLCSNSNYRPLRHTSTFIGLIFGSGLLHGLSNLAKNVSKQLEISSSSTSHKISVSQMSESDKNDQKKLKTFFNFIMNEIFCIRYRDVCHEIRVLCIAMLGKWMKIYPQEIIMDKNLKYIGWLLYDKQYTVRIQCISVLMDHLSNPQSYEMFENFLKRFKDRLLQMTFDINNDVSIQTLKLLNKISKSKPYLNCEEDFKIISRNLLVDNRKIASGSAKLILTVNGIKKTKELDQTSKIHLLNVLVSCMVDNIDFQSTILIVDAFAEHVSDLLTSWDIYANNLENSLDNDDCIEELIIVLMNAAVFYFLGLNFPPNRPLKKVQQSEIEKSKSESTNLFTASCFKYLVALIDKYYGEMDKIEMILKMIQFLNLDIIESMIDGASNLEKINNFLKDFILNRNSYRIISSSVNSLASLCKKYKISTSRNDMESKYIGQIVGQIKKNLAKLTLELTSLKKNQNKESEIIMNISHNIQIISCIMQHFNIKSFEIFEIIDVISNYLDDGSINIPNEDVYIAIFQSKTAYISSLLDEDLFKIEEESKTSNLHHFQHDDDQRLSLKILIDELLMFCDFIIKKFGSSVLKKEHIICSFCMVFHRLSKNKSKNLLLENKFIENKIFDINKLCLNYIMNSILSDEAQHTTGEGINLNQEVLIAYCTLILCGIVPIENFKLLLPYYGVNGHYSEILKHIISELKISLPGKCCDIISSVIQDQFQQCLPNDVGGKFKYNSHSFIRLKDLVRKISLLFGVNTSRFNNIILTIQKKIIDYFIENCDFDDNKIQKQNNNAYILETLMPFISRASKADKQIIYSYLAEHIGRNFEKVLHNWISLSTYLMIDVKKFRTKGLEHSLSSIHA